jgi:integrase/recombinase XerD
MAYNKDHRRGIYKKPQSRQKRNDAPTKNVTPINHNGLFPYLQAFLEWSGVKGLSPQTIVKRENALRRWILWCDGRGLDDPRAITKPILERYQKHLYYYRKTNGEPLSVRSQLSLLLPLKAFFKWLSQTNRILYNPASELELPKTPPRLPQVILSVEEIETVMGLPDTTTPYGIRDRAILETLYSTGIRKSECANLGLYDVDSHRKTLMVRGGKGGKDRVLPMGELALYWVGKYRLEVRPEFLLDLNDPYLFLTDYGEPWIKNRLSDLVKRYFYHADINKPGACHLFRHAMATHMLDNGADLRYIQLMLGHSQLSTTEIYTHVSIEKLREIHAATHPAKLEQSEDGRM